MSNAVVKKVIYTDTRYGEHKDLFDEIVKSIKMEKLESQFNFVNSLAVHWKVPFLVTLNNLHWQEW